MSDYEPPAEMVEALERDIRRLTGVPYHLGQTMSVTILRRQHERERGLLEAMHNSVRLMSTASWPAGLEALNRALVAHAKLDAPKVPSLLEAAKALRPGASDNKYLCIPNHLYEALKAAVEREEPGA